MENPEIRDPNNLWRRETPGSRGWRRSARPDDPQKYFMVSADCHANEPTDLWRVRIEKKYLERLPYYENRPDGVVQVTEGFRPLSIRPVPLDGEDLERGKAGADPEERLRDQKRDGIDAEILFPNKGLDMWATSSGEFASAMCRCWNDWAWETFGPYNDRMSPMACLAPSDLPGTLREIQRAAKLGFRGVTLPCKPVYGPGDADHENYNLPTFDPMWEVIQEVDLPVTFHIGTGKDPRGARGHGGALINYAVHALTPAIEPIANLCCSGVLERFPTLRFGTVEAGIGWVPWALGAMDEAHKKHHMWARPRLKKLPSEYFKEQGFATFQEDPAGLELAREYGLVDNFMWANDYPHHEGTWPHSAAAIERTMGNLNEEERTKILGLNAARIFKFDIPSKFSGLAAG